MTTCSLSLASEAQVEVMGRSQLPKWKGKVLEVSLLPFPFPLSFLPGKFTYYLDIAVILHTEKQKHIKTMNQDDQKTLATYTWISCYRKKKSKFLT